MIDIDALETGDCRSRNATSGERFHVFQGSCVIVSYFYKAKYSKPENFVCRFSVFCRTRKKQMSV